MHDLLPNVLSRLACGEVVRSDDFPAEMRDGANVGLLDGGSEGGGDEGVGGVEVNHPGSKAGRSYEARNGGVGSGGKSGEGAR
jgi:hypothetical protein